MVEVRAILLARKLIFHVCNYYIYIIVGYFAGCFDRGINIDRKISKYRDINNEPM